MTLRIGSLFTGTGALDTAAVEVLDDASVAWVCDNDPAATRLLAYHWPEAPNLGEITTVDWAEVEPVQVITGGFPCTDVSIAGRRVGIRPDSRSGLWKQMAYAISQLRPSLVLIENVRGLCSAPAHSDVEPCPHCLGDEPSEHVLRALGAVLGDLADLGYDAEWCGLRAADVGAPHGRYRVFILAASHAAGARREPRETGRRVQRQEPGAGHLPATDAGGEAGSQRSGPGAVDTPRLGRGRPDHSGRPAADPAGDRWHEGRTEPAGIQRGPDAAGRGVPAAADADRGAVGEQSVDLGRLGGQTVVGFDQAPAADPDEQGQQGSEPARGRDVPARSAAADDADEWIESLERIDWGKYGPAIDRWAAIVGRPVPTPTIPGARGGRVLNPALPEWMMALPAGHITAVPGLSRQDQLRLAGNGVVIPQAVAAYRHLLPLLLAEGVAA